MTDLDPAAVKAEHEDHLGGADGACISVRHLEVSAQVTWDDHCKWYRLAEAAERPDATETRDQ